MKVAKITWAQHSNMPILSVDVQPNGYRIVTGGTDHKVCIWNLLPCISARYEKKGYKRKNAEEEIKQNKNINEDSKMNDSNDQKDNTFDWTTEDDEEGFKEDIKLMEGLFENEEKKSQRLLAMLENHSSPVNCVRWNSVGTLFASAGDDGSVILWEYVGECVANAFQKYSMNEGSNTNQKKVIEESKVQGNLPSEEPEQETILEEWRSKRTWIGHKRGVIDLAWSPDNIHFGSVGIDSQVIIWSINEQGIFKVIVLRLTTGPIKVLDEKANGITFDPFGKFMATQSSEDKTLSIWRIQDYKNITRENQQSAFYKQSLSQSMFRRLSWSADGQFISTTAGKIGSLHIAPLIERSTWKQLATLTGHNKTITTSRINPRLYKNQSEKGEFDPATGQYQESLSCYSVVAIASIDSTISIWKPHMDKPFTVILDIFKMGITDLSWGFNGNILLASSHDGQVLLIHYKPGVLGHPLTEFEKQLIIEKKYGSTILNDYKKHHKVQNTGANMGLHALNHQAQNLTINQIKEQQKETVKNGKKKIAPVMVKQYDGSQNINPFMNPFHQQMLKDNTADTQQQNIQQQQIPQQPQQHQQPEVTSQATKLPSFNQVFVQQQQQELQQQQPTIIPQQQPQTVVQQQTIPPQQQQQPPKPQQQPQQQQQITQQNKEEVKKDVMPPPQSLASPQQVPQIAEIENSGKKTKKTKRKKQNDEQLLAGLQMQNQQIQQQAQVQGMIGQRPLGMMGIVPQSQMITKEQIMLLERIFETSKDIITIFPIEEYQMLTSIQGKEEMQINLPARDIFSEEIRVFIHNIDINAFARRADIKIYNSDNIEVGHQIIDGEFVIMNSVCSLFYILYTNKGQLNIYNTRTTQLIKNGLIMVDCCLIDTNEDAMSFAVATLKGNICVYKVKSLEQMLDSCVLDWQVSILDIIKQRTQILLSQDSSQAKQVYLKYLKLVNDGTVIVFLNDGSVFEYDTKMRLWRQMSAQIDMQSLKSQQDQGRRQKSDNFGQEKHGDLSSIISLLEQQQLEEQQQQISQQNQQDIEMASHSQQQQEQQQFPLNKKNTQPYQIETQIVKLNELQESVQLYERLGMKNEFLYTLRMYTNMVLSVGDMVKLRDLMVDYRFMTTAEDEALADQNKSGIRINQDQALNNLLNLIQQNEDSDQAVGNRDIEKSKIMRIIDRQQICGMEKKEVFQSAIFPVIRTLSQLNNCEVKDTIVQITKVIFETQNAQKNNMSSSLKDQEMINQQNQQEIQQIEAMTPADYIQLLQSQAGAAFGLINPLPSIQNILPLQIVGGQDLQQIQQQMMITQLWPQYIQLNDSIISSAQQQPRGRNE